MNPELFTDEFRDFKFLKSSPGQVAAYKKISQDVNMIQPWESVPNPDFKWQHRVEFLEQLLDLGNDTIYIVNVSDGARYPEQVGLFEIKNPAILTHNPIISQYAAFATTEHIFEIEDGKNSNFCLVEGAHIIDGKINVHSTRVFRLHHILPRLDNPKQIFYNKETAQNYKLAVINHLRHLNAMSIVTNLF